MTASIERAHREVEHIFRNLLPQGGLSVREGQVALCHTMVGALFQNKISLCDAGVGTGKTYAYLTAAVLLKKYRPFDRRPVVVSTSTVALQEAITREYLPFLSHILLENQVIAEPIRFAVRKGKGRYVCDLRLLRRLAAVEDKPKNPLQRAALDSLRKLVDLDSVPHLSGFDRRQVCVPPVCLGTAPSGCSAATGKPGRERATPPYLSRSATTTICLPTPPTGKMACGPCWRTTAPSSSTRPTNSRRPPGRCTGKALPKGSSWTCAKPWGERVFSLPPNGCGRMFPHCGAPSNAVKMTRTPRGWPFA